MRLRTLEKGLFALALAGSALLGAPQASAAVIVASPISLDLNSGSFVSLPPVPGGQTGTYTAYQSPTFNVSVTLAPGDTGIFNIGFAGGGLRLSDNATFDLPTEGVIFTAGGTGSAGVNPIIRVLNATGSYRQDPSTTVDVTNQTLDEYLGVSEAYSGGIRTGFFSALFPNDPVRLAGLGFDLTDLSIVFLGLQFELFNQGPNPISVTQLSFLAVGSTIDILSVPAPGALPLLGLGLGLIGIALVTRRRRIA